MEERVNTILSPMEQAWTFAKVDMNSNYFKEFGKNSNMNRVRTLYDYYKSQDFRDGRNNDSDLKDSDKTKNYFVITIDDPTGRSENGTIDLIVDATGHDVAITYVGEDGQKLEISPKILENNAEMLDGLNFGIDMSSADIAKLIAPKDMEELVRQIEKYDTIAMRSTNDAKERADEYDGSSRAQVAVEAEKKDETKDAEEKEAEVDAELKENSDIPQEMYSDIYKICIENDLNPRDLKQSLTIIDPGELISQIDNSRTEVRENGGEVTVLRFKNKEMGAAADRVFMVQGGNLLKADEANDSKMSELMESHKGNGVKIEDFEDTRMEELEARLENLRAEYESKKQQIEKNYDDVELTTTFTADKRDAAKEAAVSDLKNTYVTEVGSVCSEYQPPKTPEIAAMEKETVSEMSDGTGSNERVEPTEEQTKGKEDDDEGYHPSDPVYKRLFGTDNHN